MSLSPYGGASDNEDSDCDSFHSFNQSDYEYYSKSVSWKSSLASDCDSATGLESEHETSGTFEEDSTEPLPQAANETSPKVVPFGIPKPKSVAEQSEYSSDSSACDGVSTTKGTQQPSGRFKAPKKFLVSPLNRTEEPVPMCLREVPKLALQEMPSEDLFDLDSPQLRLKDYLTCDPQKEAMQKHAFTEIWVGSQQKSDEPKRSPLREFSVALDACFNKDVTKKTDNKQDKPIVKPAKTIIAPVAIEKPAEEYVSPFKNMPVPAAPPKESSLLNGAKKPVIVPAGFDLTRLVEYKNPNHWARRQHVRTGDRIMFY